MRHENFLVRIPGNFDAKKNKNLGTDNIDNCFLTFFLLSSPHGMSISRSSPNLKGFLITIEIVKSRKFYEPVCRRNTNNITTTAVIRIYHF